MTHHDKARELVERLKQWDGCWPAPGLERDVLAAAGAITALSERNRVLEEALVNERIDNLWNAYHSGYEKDGRWTHCCMSDGEWLARECGFDPSEREYDAEAVKAAIPKSARAALSSTGEKG